MQAGWVLNVCFPSWHESDRQHSRRTLGCLYCRFPTSSHDLWNPHLHLEKDRCWEAGFLRCFSFTVSHSEYEHLASLPQGSLLLLDRFLTHLKGCQQILFHRSPTMFAPQYPSLSHSVNSVPLGMPAQESINVRARWSVCLREGCFSLLLQSLAASLQTPWPSLLSTTWSSLSGRSLWSPMVLSHSTR